MNRLRDLERLLRGWRPGRQGARGVKGQRRWSRRREQMKIVSLNRTREEARRTRKMPKMSAFHRVKFWPFVLSALSGVLKLSWRSELDCLWYRFFLPPFIHLQNTLRTPSAPQRHAWLRKGWARETSELLILTYLFVCFNWQVWILT